MRDTFDGEHVNMFCYWL